MTRLELRLIAAVVAAFALAGPLSWAEETATTTTTDSTTTTTDSTTTTTVRRPRTTATPEMIAEAIERSKKRTERFLSEGVPEQFGSEEPYFSSNTTQ